MELNQINQFTRIFTNFYKNGTVLVLNAEEIDELAEGWRLTLSINTPTSSLIVKNGIVLVLYAEELGELVKSWRAN